MTDWPPNSGKPWSPQDINNLRLLAGQNTPTLIIAMKLGRSANSVYAKALRLGLRLKPPYQPRGHDYLEERRG